ncbi:MAG: diaminopimelate decarboxylase [Bdellovibrionales bacterium RBG_16_40_8]|nr:MAG: diaminopimelate decarboxylase [Bdellovibrionales bacterium RBG_16_40_8]
MKAKSRITVKNIKKEGTPFYLYDLKGLTKRVNFFKQKMPLNGNAFFAMKANNNKDILKVIKHAGFGVDVVSLGELNLALAVGYTPEKIVFSGVGKTKEEILAAIKLQINQINVESVPELKRIAECAEKLKMKASVALRMNPDIAAKTHPYIQTGLRENKFGLEFTAISEALSVLKKTPGVKLQGLALHIGSQIKEVSPFIEAFRRTLKLYNKLLAEGYELSTLDVGGGLGINYESGDIGKDEDLIIKYMKTANKELSEHVKKIYFEPGRILVARFGSLFTEIQYVKKTSHKNFLIVDTGMHQLLRPALYEAFHRIEPIYKTPNANGVKTKLFDIVGPICESSDVLGLDRRMPLSLKAGDILKICDVGAYGAVMSSNYNLQSETKEVCVK